MEYVGNINKVLDILNINQSELAKRLGLSRAVISEFTNGSREPSKEFILSLNRKLGISVDWFITGEGEMFLPGKDPRKPQIGNVADLRLSGVLSRQKHLPFAGYKPINANSQFSIKRQYKFF